MNPYAQEGRLIPRPAPPGDMPPPPPPTDTTWVKRQVCDLAYAGDSDSQRLNVYLPDEGEGPFPVLFFIHGGAFRGGHRTDAQLRPFLEGVKRGYAVVSVDYRLSGEAAFPLGIHDCKAALRYVKANARKLRLNARKIAAAGDSSGGNFALMLACTPDIPELENNDMGNSEYDARVQCAVTWFAPTDLRNMDSMFIADGRPDRADHDLPHSPESDYLGGTLSELDPAAVDLASPLYYIRPNLPPILMQHGRADGVVPFRQSEAFAEKADRICGKGRVTLEIIESADHADPLFETPENLSRIFDFLDEHLK